MRWNACGFVVLMAGLVIGCGGGGGGGGTDSLAYRGAAYPAAVDTVNAGELAEAAAAGTEMGLGLQQLGSFDGGAALRARAPRVAHEAVMGVVDSQRLLGRTAEATMSLNETGDCGGEVQGVFELVEDGSFAFEATMTFLSYCSGGTTVNGRITASGRTDPVDNSMVVTENFPFLTVDDGTERLALGGTVHARVGTLDQTGVITLNFTVEDLNSGEQIRLENYVIEQSETFEGSALSIQGRVYHSAHGYVDVTTDPASDLAFPYDIPEGMLAPLVTAPMGNGPSSGGVLLVGSGGSAALLHVLDETHYEVVVDTDGDQVFDLQVDVSLGPVSWE